MNCLRRPFGRFFCCFVIGMLLCTTSARVFAATTRTTRVADTVYRADGTPARGTLLISWPAFTAASGEAVASGRTTVQIGANGAIEVPLVANTGSAPASYYTVVLQLEDGVSATEYWTVPVAETTTIAAIRSKVVPTSVAVQYVGRDYVDTADAAHAASVTSALAAKANDTAVVHYAGDETISGAKTFTANPVVPTPTTATHAANKSYVDNAVQLSFGSVVSAAPTTSQSVVQPAGTSFQVNRADVANLNGIRQADGFNSIQGAIDDAGTSGAVIIPPGYAGQDTFNNPKARTVLDLRNIGDSRAGVISVKDFGARGDGGAYAYVRCTSGSAIISNVAATVGRLPKVGDNFVVSGCGASGGDLQCTLSAASGTAYGTVACGGGVTASATLSNRGARWGVVVDDTAAFVAAMNYCKTGNPNGGCRIGVPPGVYFVSNVTFPAAAGPQAGQVMISGAGRQTSWIVGIGANQTAIFQAPASSVSTHVSDLGFRSYDLTNKVQIAVQWLGGVEHTFTNNFATSVYEMVNASNTWINLISNNRCYSVTHCIEFGGSGTGPVNATRVVFNELAAFSGHAIYTHTNNASYGNTYAYNSIENDNPPFDTPVDIADNQSVFQGEYWELSPSTSGYQVILRGTSMQYSSPALGCMQLLGGNHTVRGLAGTACGGQTYTIKNDSVYNTFFGPTLSSISDTSSAFIYGQGQMQIGGLKSFNYAVGSAYDFAYSGRVDLAGASFMQSPSTGANPNAPSTYGANAVFPYMSFVLNRDVAAGSVNSNWAWVCRTFPNCANPFNPSQWLRINGASNRARLEASAAPSSGTWAVGDFVWNTGGTNGLIGWYCTAAGTPGTWSAVYAIDPASPPAIGNTTPNSVKATTVNATTGFQVNGTAMVSSCGTGTTCSNTAVGTARTVVGSVTLASGTATITGISPAFTSTSSFFCTCTDRATTPAACSIQNASASSITVKGTGTDIVNYQCVGN